MINIVKEFENYSLNIKDYIEKSNYKTKHFVEVLNLSTATFYRKLNHSSFTVNEIVKLTEILFPKEFYEFELKESIRRGREDYKKGHVVDAKELMQQLKKEYLD